jgi:hypothetical protein
MRRGTRILFNIAATVVTLGILAIVGAWVYHDHSFWTVDRYQRSIAARDYATIRSRVSWTQPKDRAQAMDALAQSDDPEAFAILTEQAKSEYFIVRYAIASNLAKLREDKRLALFELLLADPDNLVREAAKRYAVTRIAPTP